MKSIYFLFIIFFFKLRKILSFSVNEIFRNPQLYSNELCSYNGIPYYNSTTNEVTCKCHEKYADEPRKDKIKYINGHIIHCSYERKSRFFTIFLSLCFPIGIDFLYLERYSAFFLVLFITLLILASGIFLLYLNYKVNLNSKDTIIQNKFNKMINKKNNTKINEGNKIRKLVFYCFTFLLINHFIYIIIVVTLHVIGVITDAEKVKTENDLGYIFATHD